MRVRRERSTRRNDTFRLGREPADGLRTGTFQDELRLRELEREAAIEQALEDVDEAAQRLRADGDLVALHKYKAALRAALGSATRRAYKVQAEPGSGFGGRRRLLYIVRIVDEKLAELTQMLLEQERDNVAIAARLDEIRGLLLDLYR